MPKLFYIYIYRDPARNSEPIYVGKGTGRRARIHLGRKDKGPFANRLAAMLRNNISPLIEIIQAIDENHAKFMEVCCIAVMGRKDLGKGPLLNLTDGGEGTSGGIISAAQRRKISVALTGTVRSVETKEKNRNSHIGKKHTLASRKQRSINQTGRKGKPLTTAAKEKLRAINTGKSISVCSCLLCKEEISTTNISRHYNSRSCTYAPRYKQPVCSCLTCKAELPVNGIKAHQASNKCFNKE